MFTLSLFPSNLLRLYDIDWPDQPVEIGDEMLACGQGEGNPSEMTTRI